MDVEAIGKVPILVAIEKAILLQDKIDEMFTLQYTSENPRTLLNIFKQINDSYLKQLLELRQDYVDSIFEKQRDGILFQARSITDSIGNIHSYLRFVDAARVGKAQSGMVLSVELLSKKYSLPVLKMLSIIRPQWKYNFKYINIINFIKDILTEDIISDENNPNNKLPEIFGIVSFPGLDQNDVLAQVMLAHEIGHLLDEARNISKIYSYEDKVVASCKIPSDKIDEIVENRMKGEFNNTPELWAHFIRNSLEVYETNNIKDWIIRWIKEFTADIIAVRLIGPAFFLALTRFATSLISIDDIVENYPPIRIRLQKVIEEMENEEAGLGYIKFFEDHQDNPTSDSVAKVLLNTFQQYKTLILSPRSTISQPLNEYNKQNESLRIEAANLSISDYLDTVIKNIREVISKDNQKCFKLKEEIFNVTNDLHNRNIPPTQVIYFDKKHIEPLGFETILNAGWLSKIKYEDDYLSKESKKDIKASEREKNFSELQSRNNITSKLVVFGIEFSDMLAKYMEKKNSVKNKGRKMNFNRAFCINSEYKNPESSLKGVLSGKCLLDKIKENEIVISPLFEFSQIKEASIDVRLGNKFIVTRRSKLSGLDPGKADKLELRQQIRQSQEMIYVAYGEPFTLHPNEFVLGSTLEYFSFPSNVTAYVIGRSSWGRIGLVIATATQVGPGYKGTLTLELANVGVVPIVLYAGVRIAQLVMHALEEPVDVDQQNAGKYQFSTGPQFSKIFADEELEYRYIFRD